MYKLSTNTSKTMAALQCVVKFGIKNNLIEKIFRGKRQFSLLRNTCGSAFVLQTKLQVNHQALFTCNCQRPANKQYFHTSYPTFGKVVPFNLSDIGEGIREVTVKEWFVKVGDTVAQFDKICEVQSDKASVTITSRYDGKVTKVYHEVDDMALVGKPLIDIEIVSEGSDEKVDSISVNSEQQPKVEVEASNNKSTNFTRTFATPAVRRLAAENKLKLGDISGTGKNGRVLKEDIFAFINVGKIPAGLELPGKLEKPSADSIVPIVGFRKAMVRTMAAAQKIPHLGFCDEINMSELVALCSRLKDATKEKEVKITYMPFFIKAASKALKQYPVINASVDENCEHIIYKASHNIGIAMDSPNGLVVPNVKNVEELSIVQIAKELNRLQKLGQEGKLGLKDLTGGTLTLSNIGAIGGTYCSPLILSPEVAIAGLGKVQVVPRFNATGEIIKAHVMSISWSADHRIVEGATIARFSNVLKQYIEKPDMLMIDL